MDKHITIKSNNDYRRIYRLGRSYVDKNIVIYVFNNKKGNLRYGITTSKKIGKAVLRNRCKRIIRAAYFSLYDEIKPGYDFIFVARGRTPQLKSTDIYKSMKNLLNKAGLLN